jgi:hypothetical protein
MATRQFRSCDRFAKPEKPYPEYPFYAHPNGCWANVNADPEVQRLPAAGPPIEKCSAPIQPLPYGGNHARDSSPNGRRRECSPTWRSGPRSVAGC